MTNFAAPAIPSFKLFTPNSLESVVDRVFSSEAKSNILLLFWGGNSNFKGEQNG